MKIFPIGLVVQGRDCFVAGGGQDAVERVRRLEASGGRVTVFAEVLEAPLAAIVADPFHAVRWERREMRPEDLDAGPFVVIDTRRDDALAEALYERATQARVLLCAIDLPRWCMFSTLAIADVGELTVALGSGGSAPGLLRRLRDDLVAGLGGSFPSFTRYVADVRALASPETRRAAVAEAIAGLRLEIVVHYPSRWRERWKAMAPASYESGVHDLPMASADARSS